MKSEPYNPRLKALLLEVVDNQLRDNDPPAATAAYKRLCKAGYTQQQAKEKIASVVIGHIYDMMKEQKTMDIAQYEADLRNLG